MVRIIINADDFGRGFERNKAIDVSFKQGLIRSAGLIVTGKYLQNALDLMFSGGYTKDIHLHFNLSTSLRDGDPEDRPLTEAMSKDSYFCKEGKFFKYRGLPRDFCGVRKWKVVYNELVAQYKKFIEITEGKADYKHVDFHLWYNLTWPISVALNIFTIRYNIKSVRYIGLHQMKSKRFRLLHLVSWNPRVKYIPATNIDYFLTKKEINNKYPIMELYCHPNYKDGILLDDSPSYFHHDRQPLPKHMQKLKDLEDVEFISWEEVANYL